MNSSREITIFARICDGRHRENERRDKKKNKRPSDILTIYISHAFHAFYVWFITVEKSPSLLNGRLLVRSLEGNSAHEFYKTRIIKMKPDFKAKTLETITFKAQRF